MERGATVPIACAVALNEFEIVDPPPLGELRALLASETDEGLLGFLREAETLIEGND